MSIREELTEVLKEIEDGIGEVRLQAQIQGCRPTQLRDSNGRYLLHDMLVAKADLLLRLEQIEPEPRPQSQPSPHDLPWMEVPREHVMRMAIHSWYPATAGTVTCRRCDFTFDPASGFESIPEVCRG